MPETPFHILIADDDDDDQLILADAIQTLNRRQARITQVCDGAELISYLNAAAAGKPGHTMPDVVLLDINMPVLDGFETLRAIKADVKFRHLPVCVITTMRNMDKLQLSMELGAVNFFTKPNQISGYLKIMDEIMSAVMDDAR
jgi:two-component system response regulator